LLSCRLELVFHDPIRFFCFSTFSKYSMSGTVTSFHSDTNNDLHIIDDSGETKPAQSHWYLLVVDDDEEIHTVTQYALADFEYQNKTMFILRVYSAKEARGIMKVTPEIAVVLVDEQAFGQVMENLVSNAIKYSPPGKNIFISVYLFPATSHTHLRIAVRDEGPGISESDQKKLFGKFARLTAQPTGGEDSTGLGLAIVKKMVEAMNGRVWCESEVGNGATFVLELPRRHNQ
jgi:signal transduction histidine kinase